MASIRDFKYKRIKNFFTPEELKILQPYCYKKVYKSQGTQVNKEGPYFEEDPTFSPAWYNDDLMDTVLENKEAMLSEHAGLNLIRTYAFWRYYIYGSILKSHLDRPSCEVSITACIQKYDNWPITVNGKKFELEEGEGVMYLGCVLPHGRPGVYKGNGLAQVFMHYVEKDGPFAHHALDDVNKKSGHRLLATAEDEIYLQKERKKYA
jgi:hypothetical protein